MTTPSIHPVPLVLRTMWRTTIPWILLFIGGFYLIYLTIDAVILASGNQPTTSMVDTAVGGGPKYVLFSYGIVFVSMSLQTYVAFGVTRRHFAAALGVFALSLSAIIAVVLVFSYAIEHAFYVANDVLPRLHDYSYHSSADIIPLLLENWLVFYAHLAAAALIVVGYARTGAYVGTLLIPVMILPVFLTEGVFGAKWLGVGLVALFRVGPAPWPVATIVSVLTCAIASAAVYLLMRRMPVGAKIGQLGF
ncbi:hypothetical protein [Fodinicola acaciae]|uniref:hypothetical protein n=1 Tax=Fodinicola acaciae TaxID=2681555 RepID=UPI0013D621C9|nr:hypothetical protein [Fodinicola acaciae]